MSNKFASGKHAISVCDRCGHQFKLVNLKVQIVKQRPTGMRVCSSCLDIDHPQLMLGTTPVSDPQALRVSRPDNSYLTSGSGHEGSRNIQWGWNPVGGGDGTINPMLPNALVAYGRVGSVTVSV